MSGPARRPLEQKRKLGNPGKEVLPSPTSTATLTPATDIPPAPADLGETGREVWDRLWTAGQAWLSPQTDRDILTRLCQAHDQREEMREELENIGYLVAGSMGQTRINPVVPALRALESQMTTLESLCGFNPSDRGRLGYAEVKRQSKLEELFARRDERGA